MHVYVKYYRVCGNDRQDEGMNVGSSREVRGSLVLNLACSACFFSRNSVFLSQQFSRNSVFQSVSAKVQSSERSHTDKGQVATQAI